MSWVICNMDFLLIQLELWQKIESEVLITVLFSNQLC